ncbi:MAG: DMT family transporter [Campylobacterota bacterium]|nr:DMT family transporter [Campylobacterota bacterium]
MTVYVLLILCVLFWSGNFVLGRFVSEDITPFELAFFRWLFVLLMVSPILFYSYKKIFKVLKNNFKIIFVLSILGISSFNTLLYIGLKETTATNALIINSSVPILILLLSFFILKQNINIKQIIGIVISTIGVLYLILQGNFSKILSLEFNSGDLWIITSSFTWALYSVLVRFKPEELNDFEFLSTIVFIGFIILAPIYLYQGYSLSYEINLIKENYLVFIYVSFFTSILSYYFWHQGIKIIGASKTGQFAHLMPLFGAFLAYIFLDESLKFYHIIGMILIALGIYLSTTKQ